MTKCFTDRNLSDFTTYRVGGPAKRLYIPDNREELAGLIRELKKSDAEYFVMGGGSNLLFSDRGFVGSVVVMTACCLELEIAGAQVRCGAGVKLSTLVRETVKCGLSGLHRLCGIPGTVGGALRMNAGAYGGEISDFLQTVEVLAENGEIIELSSEDIRFNYRSAPGLADKIILGAQFELERERWVGPAKIAAAISQHRAKKQPLEYPSAGSVFKRTDSGPAGKFIEAAGLKGERIGNAGISTKHANFIVNLGDARAIEILALIRRAQKTVFDRFGVKLELEQRLVGFSPEELVNPEKFL